MVAPVADLSAAFREVDGRDVAPGDERRQGEDLGRSGARRLLLDREAEVQELDAALDALPAGAGQVVVLEAAAGLGKSALLEECRLRAIARGFRVVYGRGSELEREVPFGVTVQLFEQQVCSASDEERARLLSGAAGLCRQVFEPVSGDGLGAAARVPERAPHAVRHGLYWLCGNLAAERPLVVIVDDLQWADVPSREFISYLLRRREGLPVLVALATRPVSPGGQDELWQEVTRGFGVRMLRPAALSDAGIASLVQDRRSEQASERFVRACSDVTRGNPLLLRELLLELSTKNVATDDAGAEKVRRIGPANVSGLVLRRLARLPSAARALARAAAVLDEHADLRSAAALCRLELTEAADAVDGLSRVEVLEPGQRLRFAHPIVRAAIYAEMAIADRAAQHARAARLLDADRAPADHVAAHLIATLPEGDPWVVDTLRTAASRALAQGSPTAAISYLRRALAEPPNPGALPDIIAQLGAAESHAREPAAIDHLTQALELNHLPERRALIALDLGRALMVAGRLPEAIDLLINVSSELRDSDPELTLRIEAELLATARVSIQTRPLITERLERVNTNLQGRHPGERALLANLAYEKVIEGEPAAQAAELATRALGAGSLLHEEGSESPTYYYAAWTLALCDQLTAAASALDAAIAHARAHGSALGFGLASSFRANVHHRRGRLFDAEADARAALSVAELENLGPSLPFATALLADAMLDRGEFDEAAEALASIDTSGPSVDSIALNPLLFSRGRLRLARGDLQEGVADLLETGRRGTAWGSNTPAFLPWRSTAASGLARLGRRDEAVDLAEEELRLARAFGAPRPLAIALCACALLARGQTAVDLLAEAAAVLEDSPAVLDRARVLIEFGAALRRANHRTSAKAALREGLRLADRCGAVPLAEHARGELAAAGVRPRKSYDRNSLTASEQRVARMAASGMSNREIAQALFVTEKTVEWHLGQAYHKLDVHSRRDIATALGEGDLHSRTASGR